jgi:ubiquinone/menaquinone biosynthesis C-methylase UbiE
MVAQLWERGWEILLNTPTLKRWVVRQWYEWFATVDRDGVMPVMNYGYADDKPPHLEPADEPYRYMLQMYHHVAAQIELCELDVLEVGSGRGGGASYIMRYMHPRTYTGLDISSRNVAFCQKQYGVPALHFVQGDAEALHFSSESFDVVLNIESSTHYGDIEQFFREVKRVLKVDGYFLYADTWQSHELHTLYRQFERAGLTLLNTQDIAPFVLRACEADTARREGMIAKYPPRFLRGAFREFAGTPGSEKFEMFAAGKVHYVCCLLQSAPPLAEPTAHPHRSDSEPVLEFAQRN